MFAKRRGLRAGVFLFALATAGTAQGGTLYFNLLRVATAYGVVPPGDTTIYRYYQNFSALIIDKYGSWIWDCQGKIYTVPDGTTFTKQGCEKYSPANTPLSVNDDWEFGVHNGPDYTRYGKTVLGTYPDYKAWVALNKSTGELRFCSYNIPTSTPTNLYNSVFCTESIMLK